MSTKPKPATSAKGRPTGAATKGRPKGATTKRPPQSEAPASRCIKCHSTERSAYFNHREVKVAGLNAQTGEPYTSIVIRRTKCLCCGQHRDDRQFRYEPKKQKASSGKRRRN